MSFFFFFIPLKLKIEIFGLTQNEIVLGFWFHQLFFLRCLSLALSNFFFFFSTPRNCQLVYQGLQGMSALLEGHGLRTRIYTHIYFFGGCQLQEREPHFLFPGDGVHCVSRWDK